MIFKVNEDELIDACYRIMELYHRPKPNIDELDTAVDELKKKYQEQRKKDHNSSPAITIVDRSNGAQHNALGGFISRQLPSNPAADGSGDGKHKSDGKTSSSTNNNNEKARSRSPRSRTRSRSRLRSRSRSGDGKYGSSKKKDRSRKRTRSRSLSDDYDSDYDRKGSKKSR